MAKTILCPHCLSRTEEGKPSCPFCEESLANSNPPGTLAFASLLAERYTIGRHITTDGEGILYEAVENSGAIRVIVKEYFPVTLSSGRDQNGMILPKEGKEVLFKTIRMDFADLYRSIQRITPATGLAAVLDVLEQNNTVYAVLERVQGITLSRYLAEHPHTMSPAQARTLLQPILEGIAAMHRVGLVHRGVCPDNILISNNGSARLSGYGTLGLRRAGGELKSQLYDGYSAPEQYTVAEFEGRYTDVYGIAAVFYRLLTGQTPVPAPQRKVTDSLQPARRVEREIPGYMSSVLMAAMRLDPGSRMQNIPELMGALASQRAADSVTQQEPAPTQKEQLSTRTLFAGSLLVILVLFLLLMWSILRDSPSGTPAEPLPSSAPSSQTQQLLIPDVIGMTFDQLQEDSSYTSQYRFVIAAEQYSSQYKAGVIISQSPEPGTKSQDVRPLISVTISKGPKVEPVLMPQITGFTQEAAQRELDTRKIKASFVMIENNGQYASGCVAYTDPEPGSDISDPENTIVTVYIAMERDIPKIPEATPTPTPTPQPSESPAPTHTPNPEV